MASARHHITMTSLFLELYWRPSWIWRCGPDNLEQYRLLRARLVGLILILTKECLIGGHLCIGSIEGGRSCFYAQTNLLHCPQSEFRLKKTQTKLSTVSVYPPLQEKNKMHDTTLFTNCYNNNNNVKYMYINYQLHKQ